MPLTKFLGGSRFTSLSYSEIEQGMRNHGEIIRDSDQPDSEQRLGEPQGTALLFPGKGAVAITAQSLFLWSRGAGQDLAMITSRRRTNWVHASVSN